MHLTKIYPAPLLNFLELLILENYVGAAPPPQSYFNNPIAPEHRPPRKRRGPNTTDLLKSDYRASLMYMDLLPFLTSTSNNSLAFIKSLSFL
jgi:hypothetical protein